MKRIIAIFMAAMMLSTNAFAVEYTPEEIAEIKGRIKQTMEEIPDSGKTTQIFVSAVDPDEGEAIIKEALAGHKYEIVKQYEITGAYLLDFDTVEEADRAVEVLNLRDDIAYAEPDYYMSGGLEVYATPEPSTMQANVNFLFDMNIFEPEDVEQEYVPRYVCIEKMCRVIGFTGGGENYFNSFDCIYGAPFADISYHEARVVKAKGIAYGEYNAEEDKYYFYPDRNTTYNEACAFIVRCTEPVEGFERKNLEDCKKEALSKGLIKETDSFYNSMDSEMNHIDFLILLSRLLEQKAYIDTGNFGDIEYVHYIVNNPNTEGLTYKELLQKLNIDNFNIFEGVLREWYPEEIIATDENIKGENLGENQRVVIAMYTWVSDMYVGGGSDNRDSQYGPYLIKDGVKHYYPYVHYYFVQNMDENGEFDGTWSYYTEPLFKGIEAVELKNVDESGNVITNPYTADVSQSYEVIDTEGNTGVVSINPSIFLAAYVETIE